MSITTTKDKECKDVQLEHIESNASEIIDPKAAGKNKHTGDEQHPIYAEALLRYPSDESIDQTDENRLKSKLDRRIIPLLGICYLFYVSTIAHRQVFYIYCSH